MASPADSARSMRDLRHAARPVEGLIDGFADEEAHVGGDLLVAAAAGVELEGEIADLFGELEFYEVMDVFSLGIECHDTAGDGDYEADTGGVAFVGVVMGIEVGELCALF